jgi:hypothetical protein
MSAPEEKTIEPEFDPAWLTPEAWTEEDNATLTKGEQDAADG